MRAPWMYETLDGEILAVDLPNPSGGSVPVVPLFAAQKVAEGWRANVTGVPAVRLVRANINRLANEVPAPHVLAFFDGEGLTVTVAGPAREIQRAEKWVETIGVLTVLGFDPEAFVEAGDDCTCERCRPVPPEATPGVGWGEA